MINQSYCLSNHKLPQSAPNTTITNNGQAIIDSVGRRWKVSSSGSLVLDEIPVAGTTGTTTAAYVSTSANVLPSTSVANARIGTPGAYPAGWSSFGLGSLSKSIIGSGTSIGIPYCDIRIYGTTSTTSMGIEICSAIGGAATLALVTAAQYVASTYVSMVGGSLTNITCGLQVDNVSNTGGYINTPIVGSLTPTAVQTRYTATSAMASGYGVMYIYLTFLSGVAIDVTLRIGGNQLELGATPSTFAATPAPGKIWIQNNALVWSPVTVAGNTPSVGASTSLSPLPGAAPPPPSPTTRAYLIGFRDGAASGPAYDNTTPSLLGYKWDYTVNDSYQDAYAGGSIAALYGKTDRPNYPIMGAVYHLVQDSGTGGNNALDPVVAANGGYNAYYDSTTSSMIPHINQLYGLRIDHEFNGNWELYCPFNYRGLGSDIPPATWIAGWRNLAFYIRKNLPSVKIIWNPNIGQNNPFPYYPGDDWVDLIGYDQYSQPINGGNSQSQWTDHLSGAGGVNLNTLLTFSQTHNKPIVFPEWGDSFGDGYYITQFGAWINDPTHNVVAHTYWDTLDGLAATASLLSLPTNQTAYVAAFGHRTYNGTFWPAVLSVP